MAPTRHVIVGGGLAAATAAEELRTQQADAEIHVLAGESHLPYIRPPLSKELMLGKDGRNSVFVHPQNWYRDNGVVLLTGERVERIGDHSVALASGRELPFDRLLLATGAMPRRLDVPGGETAWTLRTLDDSEALKGELEKGGRRVAVIGTGWIGLELAAAARTYGNEVTVIGRGEVPLAAALGVELGTVFRELHEQNGVVFRMRTKILAVEPGRVLTDSGEIPADVVIAGVGAAPDVALAEAAGIEVDDGILTDAHLATSSPDIFAAGDVANPLHPVIGQRMRNEHWANAIAGGKVAAASMAGADAVLDDIPYFYTDQFDLGMEYSGYAPLARDARVVFRGDRDAREFIAFWLDSSDHVVAGMNVNVWDVNEQVQRLIREGHRVDAARLIDPAIDLADLEGAGDPT